MKFYNRLLSLADQLDIKGLYKEADIIDKLIKTANNLPVEEHTLEVLNDSGASVIFEFKPLKNLENRSGGIVAGILHKNIDGSWAIYKDNSSILSNEEPIVKSFRVESLAAIIE